MLNSTRQTHSLANLLNRSLTHSLAHSLTHPHMHFGYITCSTSFSPTRVNPHQRYSTQSKSVDLLVHSLIRSLAHSLAQLTRLTQFTYMTQLASVPRISAQFNSNQLTRLNSLNQYTRLAQLNQSTQIVSTQPALVQVNSYQQTWLNSTSSSRLQAVSFNHLLARFTLFTQSKDPLTRSVHWSNSLDSAPVSSPDGSTQLILSQLNSGQATSLDSFTETLIRSCSYSLIRPLTQSPFLYSLTSVT